MWFFPGSVFEGKGVRECFAGPLICKWETPRPGESHVVRKKDEGSLNFTPRSAASNPLGRLDDAKGVCSRCRRDVGGDLLA